MIYTTPLYDNNISSMCTKVCHCAEQPLPDRGSDVLLNIIFRGKSVALYTFELVRGTHFRN